VVCLLMRQDGCKCKVVCCKIMRRTVLVVITRSISVLVVIAYSISYSTSLLNDISIGSRHRMKKNSTVLKRVEDVLQDRLFSLLIILIW
jgi:hypothetical protein